MAVCVVMSDLSGDVPVLHLNQEGGMNPLIIKGFNHRMKEL